MMLFGLGVLIYRLLMCNRHPFSGIWKGPGEEPESDNICIQLGCYVHKEGSLMPPRCRRFHLSLGALSPELRGLFGRCFDAGLHDPSRPTDRPRMACSLE